MGGAGGGRDLEIPAAPEAAVAAVAVGAEGGEGETTARRR
jgi:hypothetical protein